MNDSIQDIYPLTPTQQGMLFHSLQQPGSGVYVVQVSFVLSGMIDHDAARAAWQALVMRHDVLRTAFVWENQAQPLQIVGKKSSVPYQLEDWQNLCGSKQQDNLQQWLKTDRLQGFQLNKAPLLRIHTFQLNPERCRVVISFHHIILDGWSLPLLMQDWVREYLQRLPAGATISLPEITHAKPFRDYIAWLQQLDTDAAKHYWQQYLSDFTAPTPLKLLNTQSSEQTTAADLVQNKSQGHAKRLILDASKTQALKQLAQQQRITLNTLVQSAWAILLSKLSGDSNIVYGATRAGRPASLPQVEQRVGMFINTVPMRVQIDAAHPVRELLATIQQQQTEQQPFELTPLATIRQQSKVPASASLFDSIIVFENYPMEQALAPYADILAISDISISEQTNYPLSWYIVAKDELEIKALFNPEQYDASFIEQLLSSMRGLFEVFLQSIDTPIKALPLIDSVTHQQLCVTYNPKASALPTKNLTDFITDHAEKQANTTAIYTGQQTNKSGLSYQALEQRANQLAHHLLAKLGSDKQQAIGVCLYRSEELVIALLAILKAGHYYVPMDPTYPTARLQYFAEQSQMPLLISHQASAGVVQQLVSEQNTLQAVIDLDADAASIQQQTTQSPDRPVSGNDLAYVIYTSGSTGKPKGVEIEHRNLNNLLDAFGKLTKIDKDDTLLAVTTLSFDIAGLELFLPLITGSTLVIADENDTKDSRRLADLIEQHHISLMQATPATWRLLIQSGWQGSNNLTILCGGEALDQPLAEQLLTRCKALWNVYGPTETTIWSSALQLKPAHLQSGNVPIGQPIANTRFYVLDEHQQLLPPGFEGELVIAGEGVGRGYHRRDDLSAERFLIDPFAQPHQGIEADSELYKQQHHEQLTVRMYRTGDRVRYRSDGTLDYLGRFDNQTKLRGYRIELGEIDTVLAQHPTLSQVVTLINGKDTNVRLVAFVVINNVVKKPTPTDNTALCEELRQLATAQLPDYMCPAQYVVLDALPQTLNGKVDRLALANYNLQVHQPRAVRKPGNNTEASLVSIWCELLELPSISTEDNFFEIGGHSLLVMRMRDAIKQQLKLEVDIVDLFRFPTVRSLAQHLQQSDTPQAAGTEQRQQQRQKGSDRLKQRRRKIA